MNTKEQIKAEIERRKNEWQAILDKNNGEPNIIKEIIYEDLNILAFIDSLPEEKPSEDLEKAAEEYLNEYNENEDGNGGNDWDDDIIRTFIAGANWQKGQMINYVQGKYNAYQEEYDDYYAGLRIAYEDMLKKLKEDEK